MSLRRNKIFCFGTRWSAAILVAAIAMPSIAIADDGALIYHPADAPTSGAGSVNHGVQTAEDPNAKSFMRDHLWDSTFDKAGDATYEAEKDLKRDWKCEPKNADDAAEKAKCEKLNQEHKEFAQQAGDIRSAQHTMAEISRVSDIAAVGAIGTTAYYQLAKRNASQASSLESVAQVEQVASYVSYAAGATDFAMGAYAYAQQKSQLETMSKKLAQSSISTELRSKIATAAKATETAAFSHMAIGAAKAAIGYGTGYLAQQNLKTAASLSSISEATSGTTAAAVAAAAMPAGASNAVIYPSNSPTFSTGSVATTNVATKSASPIGTGGASSYPGGERSPASSGGSGGGSGSGYGGGSAGGQGGGAGSGSGSPTAAKADNAGSDGSNANSNGPGVVLNTSGTTHWGGGSGGTKAPEKDELPNVGTLADAEGAGATSAATGINPNQVFRDATASDDSDPAAQSNEAGVNSANHSLFDIVQRHYLKISESGRVQGPSSMRLRN